MSEVRIFTKPGCPHCAGARAHYVQKGVRFDEVSVPGNPEALEQMLRLNGNQRRVPTIVEGDKVTVGFEDGS